MSRSFCLVATIIVLGVLIACDDLPNQEEDRLLISGTIGSESSHITTVGLFPIQLSEWTYAISSDNSIPLVTAPISDGQWSLDITEISETGLFKLLGWVDTDQDSLYDPLMGEAPAFSHIQNDSINNLILSLGKSGWSIVRAGPLQDFEDEWFLLDDSQVHPLSKWVFRDSTYTFTEGQATLTSTNPLIGGISIVLLGNHPSSSLTVSLRTAERATRAYDGIETHASVYGFGSLSGNLGRIGLTHVDTTQGGRVQGWVAIEKLDGFALGEITARIYGTFDVPFSP